MWAKMLNMKEKYILFQKKYFYLLSAYHLMLVELIPLIKVKVKRMQQICSFQVKFCLVSRGVTKKQPILLT